MGRKGEPVGHTCPDIDYIIATICSIIKEMESCNLDDSNESLLDNIATWKTILGPIASGSKSLMEKLRLANSSLRDWGLELHGEAEELEEKVNELQFKADRLESEVAWLKETVKNYENEKPK